MIFADYTSARHYLEPFAQVSGVAATPAFALERTKALMNALGNPQNALPVIHLAGTSGKGSTATILAKLLQAHGLRVGLGLSPHVRTLLERIQIDGAQVDEATFCRVLGEMVSTITAMQTSEWGAPTFFEIMIALSYKLFAQTPVDVVVMETGLGGRYDATNTVTRADKIALFTHIGYDHEELLGSTLSKIAMQKVGILQPHNHAITIRQAPDAHEVIAAACAQQQSQLNIFDPAKAIRVLQLEPTEVIFDLTLDDTPPLHALHLALTGAHQAENASLALVAAKIFLARMGIALDEAALRDALIHVSLPGRMEQRIWHGEEFILDGAHNPQKMQALCNALVALYPNQRFVFVVAFKQGKDHTAILNQLLPLASHLVLTHFDNHDQGMSITAADPDTLAALIATQAEQAGVQVAVAPFVAVALSAAHAIAASSRSTSATQNAGPIVVTGSLYLLAQVYATLDATPMVQASAA